MMDIPAGTLVGGDFRVEHRLGEGGMGVVYAATQASTGKRRALKVLMAARASDPEIVKRFVQEARVGGLIESEHVIDVIAAGVDAPTGIPWLAMELLDGEDLSAHLRRRGALSPAEAAAIFEPLCHALAAAHRIGVVHRDLKPSNVFLADAKLAGQKTLVKLLDFGIAKLMTDASTTTGAVGTPLWMAPEQSSRDGAISPATDVWALGLMAFRMLVGTPYWRAAKGSRPDAMSVLREAAYEPLPPASVRARELGSRLAIPPAFDAWFARAVARPAEARFASADHAWTALRAALLAFTASVPGSVVASGPTASAPTASAPTASAPTASAPRAAPPPDPLTDGTSLHPVGRTMLSPGARPPRRHGALRTIGIAAGVLIVVASSAVVVALAVRPGAAPTPSVSAPPAPPPLPSGWGVIESRELGFAAAFPGHVSDSQDSVPTEAGARIVRGLLARRGVAAYTVQRMDLEIAVTDPRSAYDNARKGMVESVHGKLVGDHEITVSGRAARDVTIEVASSLGLAEIRCRMVLVGAHLYQALTAGGPEEDAARFLDSFRLLE